MSLCPYVMSQCPYVPVSNIFYSQWLRVRVEMSLKSPIIRPRPRTITAHEPFLPLFLERLFIDRRITIITSNTRRNYDRSTSIRYRQFLLFDGHGLVLYQLCLMVLNAVYLRRHFLCVYGLVVRIVDLCRKGSIRYGYRVGLRLVLTLLITSTNIIITITIVVTVIIITIIVSRVIVFVGSRRMSAGLTNIVLHLSVHP